MEKSWKKGGKILKKEKIEKEPGLVVSQADRILHLQVGVGVGLVLYIIVFLGGEILEKRGKSEKGKNEKEPGRNSPPSQPTFHQYDPNPAHPACPKIAPLFPPTPPDPDSGPKKPAVPPWQLRECRGGLASYGPPPH